MSTEKTPLVLKDLTFTDLILLKQFMEVSYASSVDDMGQPKIDEKSIHDFTYAKEEIAYLDRYIMGKYKKVKTDSLPPKKA